MVMWKAGDGSNLLHSDFEELNIGISLYYLKSNHYCLKLIHSDAGKAYFI